MRGYIIQGWESPGWEPSPEHLGEQWEKMPSGRSTHGFRLYDRNKGSSQTVVFDTKAGEVRLTTRKELGANRASSEVLTWHSDDGSGKPRITRRYQDFAPPRREVENPTL